VRLEAACPDQACLRIRDDGAGLPPELVEVVFQPFVQADSTRARSRGGLGLGLAMVKGLVELHGGTVCARSEGVGRGVEVTLCLPRSAPALPKPAAPAPPPGAHPRRVLIIEDDADAAESLKEVLELEGHEVEIAADGPAGIARSRAFRPDVVLCDIGLPGMDGYEVARTLRADPALRHTYLVALSGYAQLADQRRAAAAGFEQHLAKPPRLDALERVLGRSRR